MGHPYKGPFLYLLARAPRNRTTRAPLLLEGMCLSRNPNTMLMVLLRAPVELLRKHGVAIVIPCRSGIPNMPWLLLLPAIRQCLRLVLAGPLWVLKQLVTILSPRNTPLLTPIFRRYVT